MCEEREDWDETEVDLAQIWSTLLDIDIGIIKKSNYFHELGGNSLLTTELVHKIISKWPETSIKNLALISKQLSLSALASLIKNSDGKNETEEIYAISTENSIRKPLLIMEQLFFHLDSIKTPGFSWNPDSQIFLTGATGYLGSSLLMSLLSQTTRNIYCLIRAPSDESAQNRLSLTLKKYNLALKCPPNVICLAGDFSKPFFGLREEIYQKLAKGIHVVFHCGAEVNLVKNYEQLEEANVGGTAQVINFCMETKIKPLHYISTIGVFAHYMGGKFEENSDENENRVKLSLFEEKKLEKDVDLEKFITGYSQTKALAEMLVCRAIELGLPAVIYRPGEIGSSLDGKTVNSSDFLYLLLKSCYELSAFPLNFNWKFAYGSIDFITDSIVKISTSASDYGKVFHVIETHLSFQEFFSPNYENEMMENIQGVDFNVWKNTILNTTANIGAASKLLKIFFETDFYKGQNYFELSDSHAKEFSNLETLKFINNKNTGLSLSKRHELIRSYINSVEAHIKNIKSFT